MVEDVLGSADGDTPTWTAQCGLTILTPQYDSMLYFREFGSYKNINLVEMT